MPAKMTVASLKRRAVRAMLRCDWAIVLKSTALAGSSMSAGFVVV
jgi:hypothetical protein